MEMFSSLVALLARRAESQPDERAYVFLGDRGAEEATITFRQLHNAALALAARLAKITRPGDRAILVFPPGLEFLVAFFGCQIARVIAVPMMVPRRQSARDSSAGIMANCEPAVALTSPAFAVRTDLQARFSNQRMQWLTVDLAEIGTTFEKILNMRAGDVLPINVPELVTAKVDGVPVMECGYGIFNGQYALRVQKMISATDTMKEGGYE